MIFTFVILSLSFILFIGIALLFKYSLEYIELHPYSTEQFSKNLIYFSLTCNALLFIFNLKRSLIFINLCVNLLAFSLFNDYPDIKVKDYRFITILLLTCFNHIYLLKISNNLSGWVVLVGYFVIWLTPLILIFNISANQSTPQIQVKKRKIAVVLGNLFEKALDLKRSYLNKLKK
jgi:hypothetical protein